MTTIVLTQKGGDAGAEKGAAHRFMEEWYEMTTGNPIGNGRIFCHESLIHVYPVSTAIYVSEIRTLLDLQKGAGHRALAMLCGLADLHSVDLTLVPKRVGKRGLTTPELRRWYKRHGFVSEGGDLYRRAASAERTKRALELFAGKGEASDA